MKGEEDIPKKALNKLIKVAKWYLWIRRYVVGIKVGKMIKEV